MTFVLLGSVELPLDQLAVAVVTVMTIVSPALVAVPQESEVAVADAPCVALRVIAIVNGSYSFSGGITVPSAAAENSKSSPIRRESSLLRQWQTRQSSQQGWSH